MYDINHEKKIIVTNSKFLVLRNSSSDNIRNGFTRNNLDT